MFAIGVAMGGRAQHLGYLDESHGVNPSSQHRVFDLPEKTIKSHNKAVQKAALRAGASPSMLQFSHKEGECMLVVFDLDGTVIDSTQALLKAQAAAWATVGRPCPPDAAILELIGLPLTHIMRTLGPDEDPEALAEAYSRAYVETSAQYEQLFDGMAELLARPFRAAVATGKSQRGANRAVRHHGLEDRFEIVLGGNSVPRPKPNPDLLYAIMEATGTRDLVMIGDTTYDLEMAHDAGVKGIGVSWGHHSTERLEKWAPVVDSVDQLAHRLGV